MSDLGAPPFDVPLDTTWLGRPLYFLPEVDSTNRRLRHLVENGHAPPGAVLLADYQSAGRGRRDRAWHAPPGSSLLLSAHVLMPSPERLGLLPLVVAVALADTVRELLALTPQLKWPNDLFLNGRKGGGVLVEGVTRASGVVDVIVGIGLNVNQRVEELAALPQATSLRVEHGAPVERGRLLATLLLTVEQRYDAFLAGWHPHDAWERYALGLGQRVTVHATDGTTWRAAICALHVDGRLRVEDEKGNTHLLDAQEVSVQTTDNG